MTVILRLLRNDMTVHCTSTPNTIRAYSRYGYGYAYRAETV